MDAASSRLVELLNSRKVELADRLAQLGHARSVLTRTFMSWSQLVRASRVLMRRTEAVLLDSLSRQILVIALSSWLEALMAVSGQRILIAAAFAAWHRFCLVARVAAVGARTLGLLKQSETLEAQRDDIADRISQRAQSGFRLLRVLSAWLQVRRQALFAVQLHTGLAGSWQRVWLITALAEWRRVSAAVTLCSQMDAASSRLVELLNSRRVELADRLAQLRHARSVLTRTFMSWSQLVRASRVLMRRTEAVLLASLSRQILVIAFSSWLEALMAVSGQRILIAAAFAAWHR